MTDITFEKGVRVTELETKRKKISIAFVGDVHYGAEPCLEEEFKSFMKKIRKDTNMYWVGMGDYMEMASKTSPGKSLYQQVHSPNDQYYFIRKQFDRVKNKCLGLHAGNHENRLLKDFNYCMTFSLAQDLGVPYLKPHATHKVTMGDKTWKIHTTHGRTGATTLTGKINAGLKLLNMHSADLYAYGHTHLLDKKIKLKYDCGLPVMTQLAFIGSFMRYLDSYGEEANYEPLIPGYVIADIYPGKIVIKDEYIFV